jgi:acetyl esterase/lipase
MLIILGVGVFLAVVGTIWFFVAHDAPILQGTVVRQIEYKPGLTLDVYLPTDSVFEKKPVVVFFHGGAWVMGIKEALNVNRFNEAINRLRQHGYAFISPDYTLAQQGKSPFPACIVDAADALRWVKENAGRYNFDVQQVGVFGESAGAHIALMAAYGTVDSIFLDTGLRLNYVVDVYGPSDLLKLYEMPTVDSLNALLSRMPETLRRNLDITQNLFGFDPTVDRNKTLIFTHRYSPIHYAKVSAPPTLIIHGDKDRVVPVSQSQDLARRLDSLQVEYQLHLLKDVDHGFINATDDQKHHVQQWIVDFIEEHYRPLTND